MLVGEMVKPELEAVALRALLTEFEPEDMQLAKVSVHNRKMKLILSRVQSGFIVAVPT
jgi:hypothetical protein